MPLKLNKELIPRLVIIKLLIIALIGFADATYLTVEHYRNVIPPCTTEGCEVVLTSVYSTIWGMPIALTGAVYYFLVLLGVFIYFDSKKEQVLRYTLYLTPLGFLASLYFLFLQAFVIKAFCQYCLLSALTSTLLFIVTIYIFTKFRLKT